MERTTRPKIAAVVAAGAAVVASVFAVPLLNAASTATETHASAAAAGLFPSDGAALNGLVLQASRFGLGVVIADDGSAVGQFQAVLAATTPTGEPRSVALEGKAARGAVTGHGSITISGTATVRVGHAAPTTLPFRVAASASGLVLTIGTIELPRQTLTRGSIFIG